LPKTFADLGLSEKALDAVTAAGFTVPTPIQEQAIPIAVTGRDVLGIAQTGTGKTASFVLPMVTRLERGRARARMPRSLILAPTRELAAQCAEQFAILGKNHKLTVALLIGGVSFDDQNKKLDRGADVLIATPGRLLDHFQRGKLLMTGVEILVIDEADRMLDMGFIPDIERICSLLPPARQTLFFSATMPPEIQRLVDRFLTNPERVEVARPATTAKTITQQFCRSSADPKLKRAMLRELIRHQQVKNAIIFCNRKRDVAILHKSLVRHGFNAGALHGDMDQHHRMATLEAFRNGQITLLAASNVAARGLDIPDVSHIFNYDVPIDSDDYVHRIGRTGRAGKEGHATTLVTPMDAKMMRIIEKMVGTDRLEWITDLPDQVGSASEPAVSDSGREAHSEGGSRRRPDGRGSRRDRGPRREDRDSVPLRQPTREGAGPVESTGDQRPTPRSEVPDAEASRRRRGGRNRREGEHFGGEQTEQSQRTSGRSREPSSRPLRYGQDQRPRRERPDRGGRPAEDTSVRGLGDHVPDFLKRAIKI
jgi:superfamily II DNA/RNA helicase